MEWDSFSWAEKGDAEAFFPALRLSGIWHLLGSGD